jgi:arsenate reductase
MKILGLKNCDSCRNARKALAHHNPDLIDIRADPLPAQDLSALLDEIGADDLLNRKSKTWRDLSESDKSMSPLDLLTRHPALMKRPVIQHDGRSFIGTKAEIAKLL